MEHTHACACEDVAQILREIKEEFNAIYVASENRISQTNEMVCRLASAAHDITTITNNNARMHEDAFRAYDKHLQHVQERCDRLQTILIEEQANAAKLTELLQEKEKTMQMLLASLSRINMNITK